MADWQDEYKPLEFYAEHSRPRQSGFAKFEHEGAFYFCRYVDGNIVLISQSYVSTAGRDNGVESVKKNEKIKSRYRFVERDDGQHGFSLIAGNGQEIGVSPNFKTLEDAEHVTGRIRGTVKKKAAPKKTTTKKSAKAAATSKAFTSSDGRRGNYRPLAYYYDNGGKTSDGFDPFDHDGAYYFSYRKNDDIRLISESYVSAAGRKNGMDSVEKNLPDADRYKHRQHKNGHYYFDLLAGNHQEIATSPWYDTEEEALHAAADLRGEIKAKSGADHDNYMPLAFYQEHSQSDEDGFETFKGGNDLNYFVYRQNGNLALVSEGYPTKAACETGRASVEKNMMLEERYDYRTGGLDGEPGYCLKAGNHREIARSVPYADEAAALAGATLLFGGAALASRSGPDHDNYQPYAFYRDNSQSEDDGFETFQGEDGLHYFLYRQDGDIHLVSEGYPTKAARETGRASVEKNMPIEARYDYSQGGLDDADGFRLKAGNHREIARSVPYPSAAAAMGAAALLFGGGAAAAAALMPDAEPEPTPAEPIDNYLPCDDYKDHPITDEDFRVAEFQHENGQYYFVFYDEDGDVRWRSEGFLTEAAREEELTIARRVHDNPDCIKRMDRGERYIDMLHDETGREIGRSCLCTIVAAPVAAAAPLAAGAAVAAAAIPAAAAAAPPPAVPVEPPTPEPEPAPAAYVDEGAAGGAGIWGWLKWLLLALLLLLAIWLLSKCFGGGDKGTPPAAPAPDVTPVVACWDGSEAETEEACPARLACADGSFVTDLTLCPVVEVTCPDGSTAATLNDCPAPVEPTPAEPVVEPEPEPEPPTPDVTCWDGSMAFSRAECPERVEPTTAPQPAITTTAVGTGAGVLGFFDGPSGLEPTLIRRLGTYPEFGDSHDLTPTGFYEKLSARYDQNDYDRIYLDNLFRAIGFSGGFRDADASIFSNTQIEHGTLGILGFAETHSIQYVDLSPTSERDLQAFQIVGANGTVVYFMKTCGNYFYPVTL